MTNNKNKKTLIIGMIGGVIVALILILGMLFMGIGARKDAKKAASQVSSFYLDELASRREDVVSSNLKDRINDINTALELMTVEDLSTEEKLKKYQSEMKIRYKLEKFAFVDTNGLIYTSLGTQTNIDDYSFDYRTLNDTDISILNLQTKEKRVIIAVPVPENKRDFNGETLVVCFMEIKMSEMLEGVSMSSSSSDSTFCNIYTSGGIALSDAVLGGLASEDNLLDALKNAKMKDSYSYSKVIDDFNNGRKGIVSFTYGDIQETLAYEPVENTDWFLTYLIRESVISNQIGKVSSNILIRSIVMSVVASVILIGLFVYIIIQNNKNSRMMLDAEAKDIENKIKQDELQEKLELQERLLEQNKLILALSSDYWGVYYIELDKDEGLCYQQHINANNIVDLGESFKYTDVILKYANQDVSHKYKEEFLNFVNPNSIKDNLKNNQVISYRYLVNRNNVESYEMIKIASVRHPSDREDDSVHAVAICFTNVDEETRASIVQNEMLSDALTAAEQANKAKTIFLSNMSHEIRTPMNAIIGLDNIALNDPDTPKKTKDYLEKIDISAKHLLTIINDILDLSRIESGKITLKNEEFSFAKLLEQVNAVISTQCKEKGIEYGCYIKGKIDDYYIGDDMKLRQIMINILGNAVKFTNSGGSLIFEIREKVRYKNNATLCFKFKDTGIGMSKEYLPHLFDAFSQENSNTSNPLGSTGLGMPITKNIVDLMNGNIEVKSEKGVGTEFKVVVTLGISSRKISNNSDDLDFSKFSVLIIDDDEIACEHGKVVLNKVGIKCNTALSGYEGIEKVKMNHSRGNDFDLILIDWKMPELDGLETTNEIRKIVGNDTPIIILTAYKWDDIIEDAKRVGVDSFVSKPLFAENVIEEFNNAFRKKNSVLLASKADLKGKRILLAEDVEINAEIMVMILETREMKIDLAENGKIALDKFSQSDEGYYDAILMDIRMPIMNGLEATKRIRALNRLDSKSIPIIALTANAHDDDVQRSMQAGLNAHLSKPIDANLLFNTLENLIKS